MGYVDRFISDKKVPDTKAISVRLSLNKKTLKNLNEVMVDGGYATYSMTVARLIDAKAGRIKARETASSSKAEKSIRRNGPLTLELPDYDF